MREDDYNNEHRVIIILKSIQCSLSNEAALLQEHINYYKELKLRGKLITYGAVMNDNSVCIILDLSSHYEFERILAGDPALGKLFEASEAIPFKHDAV